MNTRLFKVQDLLHKEVAFLLLKEIQNPLIKAITISGVKVSKKNIEKRKINKITIALQITFCLNILALFDTSFPLMVMQIH